MVKEKDVIIQPIFNKKKKKKQAQHRAALENFRHIWNIFLRFPLHLGQNYKTYSGLYSTEYIIKTYSGLYRVYYKNL